MASSYHIDARSYLSAHGVVDKLKQAMADIVRDHPVDPVAALGHAMIAMGSTPIDEKGAGSAPNSADSPVKPSTPKRPPPKMIDIFGSPVADPTTVALQPIDAITALFRAT